MNPKFFTFYFKVWHNFSGWKWINIQINLYAWNIIKYTQYLSSKIWASNKIRMTRLFLRNKYFRYNKIIDHCLNQIVEAKKITQYRLVKVNSKDYSFRNKEVLANVSTENEWLLFIIMQLARFQKIMRFWRNIKNYTWLHVTQLSLTTLFKF